MLAKVNKLEMVTDDEKSMNNIRASNPHAPQPPTFTPPALTNPPFDKREIDQSLDNLMK